MISLTPAQIDTTGSVWLASIDGHKAEPHGHRSSAGKDCIRRIRPVGVSNAITADSRRRLRARLQHAELILEIQKKPPRSWDHPEDLFLGPLELLIFACRESRTCMLFAVIEVP